MLPQWLSHTQLCNNSYCPIRVRGYYFTQLTNNIREDADYPQNGATTHETIFQKTHRRKQNQLSVSL